LHAWRLFAEYRYAPFFCLWSRLTKPLAQPASELNRTWHTKSLFTKSLNRTWHTKCLFKRPRTASPQWKDICYYPVLVSLMLESAPPIKWRACS
jgi:hypothetical protein